MRHIKGHFVVGSRQHGLPRHSPPAPSQISKVAAASTIPVTSAAVHANSRRSFRTLTMVRPPHVGAHSLRSRRELSCLFRMPVYKEFR
jgi:hypothetical protein